MFLPQYMIRETAPRELVHEIASAHSEEELKSAHEHLNDYIQRDNKIELDLYHYGNQSDSFLENLGKLLPKLAIKKLRVAGASMNKAGLIQFFEGILYSGIRSLEFGYKLNATQISYFTPILERTQLEYLWPVQ